MTKFAMTSNWTLSSVFISHHINSKVMNCEDKIAAQWMSADKLKFEKKDRLKKKKKRNKTISSHLKWPSGQEIGKKRKEKIQRKSHRMFILKLKINKIGKKKCI